MATPILNITEIQAAQNQKEVTANTAFRALEAKMADVHTADFTSGDVTLTDAEWRDHGTVLCTNVTVARALNTPAIKGFMFVDNSAGTDSVTVTRGTGTVLIPAGEGRLVYQDGTTNGILNAGGGGGSAGETLTGSAVKPHKGALVFLTANEAISAATATRIPWDAAQYDTGFNGTPFWSAGSPTRLTVPAGVTKVRLTGQTFTDGAGNQGATIRFAAIRKNGNYGNTAQHEAGLGFARIDDVSFNDQLNVVSSVLEVSAGDYFELDYFSNEATDLGTVTGDEASWFAIEVVEDEESLGFFDRAKLLHVQDQKAATTEGGTFTSGSYQTRDLNTVVTNEISGASVGTNQITLPAGRYYIEARAPALQVGKHKLRLRDTTGSANLIIGQHNVTDTTETDQTVAQLAGQFVLTQTSVLELQHRCATTKTTNGLGAGTANFGDVEVFADVRIWQMPELEAGVAIQGALFHVQDQKAANTAGGSTSAATTHTRTLNTVVTNEIAGASLASNQMTLPPGDYYIEASCGALQSDRHKAKLRDTTGAVDLIIGTSEFAGKAGTANILSRSLVRGRFTLSTTSALELQHYIQTALATNGFGVETNNTEIEVYADVRIWKLKTIGSGPRDVNAFFIGTVGGSTLLHQTVAERAFLLSDDFAGSEGFADTAPSGGTAVFDIERNGTAIGTMTFADGVQTATFATTGSGNEFFVEGDVLTVRSQATLNSVADVSIDLKAFYA